MAESIKFRSSRERNKRKNEDLGEMLNRATTKKHKKHKKHKKKGSSSEANSEEEWVEKKPLDSNKKLQRDAWMVCDEFVPTFSKSDIKIQKEVKPKTDFVLEDKELNPYWKNGGTGLPENNCIKNPVSTSVVGDGGISWLKRAYQRALDQAKEENKSIEEIAAERWGSLEAFKKMLTEAEDKCKNYSNKVVKHRTYSKNIKLLANDNSKPNTFIKPSDDWNVLKQRSDESSDSTYSKGGKYKVTEDIKTRYKESDILTYTQMNELEAKLLQAKLMGKEKLAKELESTLNAARRRKSDKIVVKEKTKNINNQCSESNSTTNINFKTDTSSLSNAVKSNEKMQDFVQEKQLELDVFTDAQLNELGAKLMRAELMGNEKLAKQLEAALTAARKKRENSIAKEKTENVTDEVESIILTKITKTGMEIPIETRHSKKPSTSKTKNLLQSEVDLEYFSNDNYTLSDMVKREKMETADDFNATFAKLAGRNMPKIDSDYTVDDVFINSANLKLSDRKMDEKEKLDAIMNFKQMAKILANCSYCLESSHMSKHLIVAVGKTAYLSLPRAQSLTEGHCLIVPIEHEIASTMLDEDVWYEMQAIRKSIVRMFQNMKKDVIFLEICTNLKKKYHMLIEAIPVDQDIGSLAPIYFKKAILECDSEWAMNKKLIDLAKSNVRKSVPKGLPYFSVDFGLDGGFAHVIENRDLFPQYFGREIIGGMLDVEPRRWRKPVQENFEDQCKKVLHFTNLYKNYDFSNM